MCQTVSASELEVKTSNWEKSVTFSRLNTLKAVASNKPKFLSNLNFEFIGQGLVLEGTTEQRMVSFQKQNYRFNLIKENSNSKASLTTSLEGDSTALFDAVELDLNTLMTSETLSFQYGFNSKKTEENKSSLMLGVSKRESDYYSSTTLKAGLVSLNASRRFSQNSYLVNYQQSFEWGLAKQVSIVTSFNRYKDITGKGWDSEELSYGAGIKFTFQKYVNEQNKNANSLGQNKWNLKFFSSDGIGSATGKFSHKMQNYNGKSQYNSILPVATRASRIRGLYSFSFGRLGAEIYRKRLASHLSLTPLKGIITSSDMYSALHQVDIEENGISFILEKDITRNGYLITGLNISNIDYKKYESFERNNNFSTRRETNKTPFAALRLGFGSRIQLNKNYSLFIETSISGIDGGWFGEKHRIIETDTAIGIGLAF